MKNLKGFISGFVLASLLVTPLPVLAKEVAKKINVKENVVTIKADKYQKTGQKIYIINNTVYVPMRSIAQVLHKNVSYDSKRGIVNYSGGSGH